MIKKTCLLCGSVRREIILATFEKRFFATRKAARNYNLVRCLNCGFVYLDFVPVTRKDFSAMYPQEYWHADGENFFQKALLKILILSKYKRVLNYKRKGKLLDVGCGTGEFLKFFGEKNWEVYGQDVSKTACLEAKNKIKNIYCGRLSEAGYKSNYFDLVFLNSVLHQMEDPINELRIIRRLIKKDGLLFISVPNIASWQFSFFGKNWFHLDSPRHFYYFEPKSVASLLNKAGFKVRKIGYPLEECPLDLFHSLKHFLPKIFWPIILPFSLVLKLFPRFRGIMQVVAIPDPNNKYNG